MKPSLRINQLIGEIMQTVKGASDDDYRFMAILQYLDEEYERNKPCEHKTTEIREDGYGRKFKKCMVCGQSPV